MTTPAKQELIRQARRAALRARLIGDGFLEADWLKIRHPGAKPEQETDEGSFWLASKLASHRFDHRITLGLGDGDFGRYLLIAMLDGREAMEVALNLEGVSS
jgi:hypothetical protein